MLGFFNRILDSQTSRREIVRLALLLLVLVLAGGGALVGYMWSAVNAREAVREAELVDRTLARGRTALADQMLSGAVWNEAYEKTTTRPDPAWVRETLAHYYEITFRHDATLVLDGAGRLQSGVQAARPMPSDAAQAFADELRPWIQAVQAEELSRRAGKIPAGPPGQGGAAVRVGLMRVGGQAYLFGVATVVPTDGAPTDAGPTPVVASGVRVDQAFLAHLQAETGVGPFRMATQTPAPGEQIRGLPGLDGQTAEQIAWRPARPGWDVLKGAEVGIVGALILLFATTAVLGLRIRGLFSGLSRKDSELQTTLQALMAARDEAQSASAAKSAFIANMSHEIRTPLNGVLGMAQALEREPLTAAQHERVAVIGRSGRALLGVLNDVLDIAKIEAGRLEVRLEPFRLDEVLTDACAAYAANADAKGLSLTCSVEAAAGWWLGDAHRIRQVLLNLISNAIKFTEAGSVHVAAAVSSGGVTIDVQDTGIGISADDAATIFQTFSQIDGAATRRAGGTGLGLAISRSLARLMGGDVVLMSAPGRGCIFELHLPLQPAEAGPAAVSGAMVEVAARPLRLLAAEDNEINQLVLRTLLAPLDAELVIVPDGAEAVRAWEAEAFDAVLMDIQMPGMDGVTATGLIRRRELAVGRPRVPIIALTANALDHQRRAYLDAGFDLVVAKPLEAAALFAALQGALSTPEPVSFETARSGS
jgi:signal transduction histidine kinase